VAREDAGRLKAVENFPRGGLECNYIPKSVEGDEQVWRCSQRTVLSSAGVGTLTEIVQYVCTHDSMTSINKTLVS